MAGESPSDWVSFADYLGLTGDEMRRMDAESKARAQGLEAEAQQRLAFAGQEAQRTGQQLSQTASYGDYLKAQQAAKQAAKQAAMQQGGAVEPGDWAGQAVRDSLGLKSDASVSGRLAQSEAGWGRRANEWQAQRQQSAAAWQAAEKAKRDADAARRASDADKRKQQGYDDEAGEAYRRWSGEVESSRRRSGGIGAGAYYGGNPVKG